MPRRPLPAIREPLTATQVARPVCVASPNARDLPRRFPELAAAVATLEPATLRRDGEIAEGDRGGEPNRAGA